LEPCLVDSVSAVSLRDVAVAKNYASAILAKIAMLLM
jgi:hypothetical protein